MFTYMEEIQVVTSAFGVGGKTRGQGDKKP